MGIIKELSPIFQLFLSLGSLFGVYLSMNNKMIRQESKIQELEARFARKDKYDDELKADVKKLITDVTQLSSSINFLINSNEKENRRNHSNP